MEPTLLSHPMMVSVGTTLFLVHVTALLCTLNNSVCRERINILDLLLHELFAFHLACPQLVPWLQCMSCLSPEVCSQITICQVT